MPGPNPWGVLFVRACESVLDLATADWIHETVGECPAEGCPFVGRSEGEPMDGLLEPLDRTG